MKKLSIEKFKISKLNDYSKINGGDQGVTTGETGTGNDDVKQECVMGSLVMIEKPVVKDKEVKDNG